MDNISNSKTEIIHKNILQKVVSLLDKNFRVNGFCGFGGSFLFRRVLLFPKKNTEILSSVHLRRRMLYA